MATNPHEDLFDDLLEAFKFHYTAIAGDEKKEVFLIAALEEVYEVFARTARLLHDCGEQARNSSCPAGWKECNGTCIPVDDPCPPVIRPQWKLSESDQSDTSDETSPTELQA